MNIGEQLDKPVAGQIVTVKAHLHEDRAHQNYVWQVRAVNACHAAVRAVKPRYNDHVNDHMLVIANFDWFEASDFAA